MIVAARRVWGTSTTQPARERDQYAALVLESLEPRVVLAANLVQNGGFESHEVSRAEGWDVFPSIPAWGLTSGTNFELQRGILGGPAEGYQHLELDGDQNGPGTPSPAQEKGSIAIYQNIATTVGRAYRLEFAFAGRPGTDATDNVLQVHLAGSGPLLVDETLTTDASGWRYYAFTFIADASETELRFADKGVDNTFGTFLDDVSVVEIPLISIQAVDDLAHEAGLETGQYVITREGGDLSELIPLQVKISGDAIIQDQYTNGNFLAYHYALDKQLTRTPDANDGNDLRTISMLPGVERIFITLRPVTNSIDNAVRKATIEILTPEIKLYAVKTGYDTATVDIIPDQSTGDVLVKGKIEYEGPTAIAGNSLTLGRLALRGAQVQVWDRNGVFGVRDVMLATAYTNEQGEYEVRISSADTATGGGYVDPYIVIVAQSRPQDEITIAYSVSLSKNGPAAFTSFVNDGLQGQAPGTATLNAFIPDSRPTNAAFSVFDAYYTFTKYHAALPGVTATTVKSFIGSRSVFLNEGIIQIGRDSRFSWDTIGHEYGHFVHHHAGVDLTRGTGSHSFRQNLRFRFNNMDRAVAVAYVEGFATYFSQLAQLNSPAPPAGVGGYGDLKIQSIRDDRILFVTDIESELATSTRPNIPVFDGLGEDNEVSVFRVLWDLYDPANDDPIGDLGELGVWRLVTAGDASETTDLLTLYNELVNGAPRERIWDVGEIFADHNVAPDPLRTTVGGNVTEVVAANQLPTFTIAAPYGVSVDGFGARQDKWLFHRVEIAFFDHMGNRIQVSGSTTFAQPAAVPSPLEVSWTPSAAQWNEIVLAAAGQPIRWSVVASTAYGNYSSRYESDARTLNWQ